MCMLLYVKPIWCNCIEEIYAKLDRLSICHGYMTMLLYKKPIWCNDIPKIYAQLEWGVNLSWLYVHAALYETYLV